MAIPRSNLTALDGFDTSIHWDVVNANVGERMVRWLTGGALLALHMSVFGAALLATFGWSLIRHPLDLSALNQFQIWGVIVGLHATLVGAYQLAARMLGWNDPTYVTTSAPARLSAPTEVRQTDPTRVWAARAEVTGRVDSSTQRGPSTVTRKVQVENAGPRSGEWPQQPTILATDERVDVGEVTWPAAAPLSTVLSGNAEMPNTSDQLVSIDAAATGTAADGAQTWVDGFVQSRTKSKEQRWSWVEAAAASWLSRRPGSADDDKAPETDVVATPQEDQAERDSEA
jgi:hypothetical protein